MWDLDHKEGPSVMLEKTLESPLDSKGVNPVIPKGNQPWIFIGRTGAAADTLILWPPDGKSQLIGKDLDAGQDWGQEEKRVTEDEMVGWHHWLHGHEFEQALGVCDGQGSLACCSPWVCKELDTTEWLNWTVGAKEGEGIRGVVSRASEDVMQLGASSLCSYTVLC